MPPKGSTLSAETLEKRNLARLQEILAGADKILGKEEETPTLEDLHELKRSKVDGELDLAIEAEATLLYYETKGTGFTRSKCPQCGQYFAFRYKLPGINLKCSNKCRAEALELIGIKWDYTKKPEERWLNNQRGVIPLIVPPAAYEILEQKLQEESSCSTDLQT